MSLSGDERAASIYRAVAAQNPNIARLSGSVDASGVPTSSPVKRPDGSMGISEKYAMLLSLRALWGADTSYLVANTQVTPGTLAAQAGIPVSTSGSPTAQTGSTTGNGPLSANGRGGIV